MSGCLLSSHLYQYARLTVRLIAENKRSTEEKLSENDRFVSVRRLISVLICRTGLGMVTADEAGGSCDLWVLRG
jgi:hypothetical protein